MPYRSGRPRPGSVKKPPHAANARARNRPPIWKYRKGCCAPFLCRAIVPQQQFGNGQSVELGSEGRPVSLLAGERQVFLRYLERRREVTLAVTEGSSDAECPHPHCRAAAG